MIFAVSFEIIIQRAVGNESFHPIKKHSPRDVGKARRL
jgi:hypothetical protein